MTSTLTPTAGLAAEAMTTREKTEGVAGAKKMRRAEQEAGWTT